ncbi:MAG: leucine-rich repeat domain-containing protein [Clostridia bacterium]|nr:leucine-rich repeat domain-containing protein [Clostridia bacterium]
MSDFIIKDGVLIEYRGADLDVAVPKGVTEIGEYAFSNDKWKPKAEDNFQVAPIKSVVLPEGLIKIDYSAFRECTSLEKITFPNSLEIISSGAFWGCASLKDISFPQGLKWIDNNAFLGCKSLGTVILPDSITYVGESVFPFMLTKVIYPKLYIEKGEKLVKCQLENEVIAVPHGVKVIKEDAFNSNKAVKKIILPDTVNSIENSAFENCSSLEEIVFSNSIATIDAYAFSKCTSLKSLYFPNSVKELKADLVGLASLESIHYPSSATEARLAECQKLKKIDFSEKTKSVVISKCDSLEKLVLPESTETLTLHDCNSIKTISFSKKLWACSIKGCNTIKEIILPEGTSRVGVENCSSLEHIYIPKSVTYLGSNIFNGVKNGLNITYGGSFEDWQKLISDRETYDGNGPTLNQYHYLGELSWAMYAPEKKTESIIHSGFEYNLKCEQ